MIFLVVYAYYHSFERNNNLVITYCLFRYDEEKHYDYRRGRSNGGGIVGHFTQLVWKATTKVGVGVAQKGTETVVVARYTSAGNFRGRYTENVMTRNPGGNYVTLLKDK